MWLPNNPHWVSVLIEIEEGSFMGITDTGSVVVSDDLSFLFDTVEETDLWLRLS